MPELTLPDKLTMIFEPFINYESIVSVKYPNTDVINSACMGVHFTPTDEIYLHAYSETDTKKLLEVGKKFVINFSEDFYEYVLAALMENGDSDSNSEIPLSRFSEISELPILKSTWVSVICKVIPMPDSLLKKPFCKRREEPNIRGKIKSIEIKHFPKIFNNRLMNLALEALIISTRMKLYDKYSKEYKENLSIYLNIKKKLNEWRNMDRFHDGFEVMDNHLISFGIKPQEIFNFH